MNGGCPSLEFGDCTDGALRRASCGERTGANFQDEDRSECREERKRQVLNELKWIFDIAYYHQPSGEEQKGTT